MWLAHSWKDLRVAELPRGDVQIHPTALCESARVGPGTRIWAFAHVMPGAIVGSDCNLCDRTYVDDGATLGDRVTVKNGVSVWERVTLDDDVFVGPGVAFTNDRVPRAGAFRTRPDRYSATVVRPCAVLGANATIVCGVVVGTHALVGAGSVVTRDIDDHAIVVGTPARQIGWICECGGRLDGEMRCRCGLVYRRVRSGVEPYDRGMSMPVPPPAQPNGWDLTAATVPVTAETRPYGTGVPSGPGPRVRDIRGRRPPVR